MLTASADHLAAAHAEGHHDAAEESAAVEQVGEYHPAARVRFRTHAGEEHPKEEVEEETTHVQSGIHGHDLALGSGSVDGLVGGSVHAQWKRTFFSGEVQYTIRSGGDFGYRYANDFS